MGRLPRDHRPLVPPNIVCITPGCRSRTGFNVFCGAHRESLPFADRSRIFAAYLRSERIRRKQSPQDVETLRAHLETPEGQRASRAIDAALTREPGLMD